MASIDVSPTANGLLLRISGRIDSTSASELEKEFRNRIAANNPVLIVDLSATNYISSAGLRSFLVAYKLVKPMKGRILLCGANTMITEIFETTGMHQVFEFFASVDAAEAAARSGGNC